MEEDGGAWEYYRLRVLQIQQERLTNRDDCQKVSESDEESIWEESAEKVTG